MQGLRFTVIALVLVGSTAQAGDKSLALILRGNYTTSSKLFVNPDASSEEQRAQFAQFDRVAGGGVELRYHWLAENLFFTLSVDYLSKRQDQDQIVAFAGTSTRVPVTDGFYCIPVELGVHTYIPLGSETLRMSMGGGVGVYYGARVLRVANVSATRQPAPLKIGIHIVSGFEYQPVAGFWLRGDMRFRDPELRTVNRFSEQSTEYNNVTVTFPRTDVASKINLDGLTFSVGIIVELL
jgi:hypothetical protein